MVLIFQVAATIVAVDLAVHFIAAGAGYVADVKFGRGAAARRIADVGAVHPHMEGRTDRTEVQHLSVGAPVPRQVEAAPVEAQGVAVVLGIPCRSRHERGNDGAEGVLPVRVDRGPEALHFPVTGYLDRFGEGHRIAEGSRRCGILPVGQVAEVPGTV